MINDNDNDKDDNRLYIHPLSESFTLNRSRDKCFYYYVLCLMTFIDSVDHFIGNITLVIYVPVVHISSDAV